MAPHVKWYCTWNGIACDTAWHTKWHHTWNDIASKMASDMKWHRKWTGIECEIASHMKWHHTWNGIAHEMALHMKFPWTWTGLTCEMPLHMKRHNSQQNKSGLIHAIMHTTSKRIELESPGCSGFKCLWICFKSWATGTFKLNSFRNCMHVNTTLMNWFCYVKSPSKSESKS